MRYGTPMYDRWRGPPPLTVFDLPPKLRPVGEALQRMGRARQYRDSVAHTDKLKEADAEYRKSIETYFELLKGVSERDKRLLNRL